MFFVFLGISAKHFVPKLEEEEKTTPRILYTSYGQETEKTKNFNKFQELTNKNETFLTAGVDCLKHKTFCSRYKLLPNEIYVSFKDHEKNFNVKTEITIENLQELSAVVANNGYLYLNSESSIAEKSKNKPLFLFVTRPNAGDLEEKKPIFEEVTSELVGRGVIFGYVDDAILYYKYSHYPYISVVFVPPQGEFVSFKDQFTSENIIKFVNEYSYKRYSEPSRDGAVEMIIVGDNEYLNEMESKYENVSYNIRISYLSSLELEKASALCNGKHKCIALANLKKGKVVSYDDIDASGVESCINDFESSWKKMMIVDKLKTMFFVFYSFNKDVFIVSCCLVFAVSFLLLLHAIGSKGIIGFDE